MDIAHKAVLVTGANRGLGRALVEEALQRGARRVYAGTRQPVAFADPRVTPLMLDITNAAQIEAARGQVDALDVLVNNAGVAQLDQLSDRATLERHLAVNFYGPYGMTQAFLPLLTQARGALVNVLSLAALAPLPVFVGYSISKAAALSLTQSLRAYLAAQGVSVHGVLAGPIDTEMSRGFAVPKSAPEAVARAVFDGVARGEEEIFPDPLSATMAESWNASAAKSMERRSAGLLQSIAS
ncbi:MAG TPA: SDR family NAD(P)-dependent oxidoreductase [Gemmatimonadales bacterium]|nr:SDR family NAD(P)-dependent oxidoreductase [Gemmatimonadales bacterium]